MALKFCEGCQYCPAENWMVQWCQRPFRYCVRKVPDGVENEDIGASKQPRVADLLGIIEPLEVTK